MELQVTPLTPASAIKITLTGRLDTAGVDRVETRFNAAAVAGGGHDTLVDLGGVDLVTSMGLRLFITAARGLSQRHKKMVLFGARDLVREVLETAAIDTLIATVATETEARALVGA
ncbi:MAG: STAS domain-containing protein [Burkholderiales bacterium]|nr:STAS domain-containing protein [Burkholderiales bacterium]